MPTKTRSPSWISREATATISSCDVYGASLIAEVGRGRVLVVMNAKALDVDAVQIRRAIGNIDDPALQPACEAVLAPRLLRVLAIERVVALEISLHGRRVCAARLVNDRNHLRFRQQDAIWIAQHNGS